MGWFGHEAGQYFFKYDEDWLSSAHAYVLAPQFALQPEPHRGETVKTFFCELVAGGGCAGRNSERDAHAPGKHI